MPYVVVTTCTDRKRQSASAELQARSLLPGSLTSVASAWSERIAKSKERVPAEDLYCGRSFSEARASASALDGDFWVVSAGLGLVDAAAPVPAYSLTIASRAADAITRKVRDDEWSAPAWWLEVGKSQSRISLSSLISRFSKRTFLVALSMPYAKMVQEDLESIDLRQLRRLRLFGLSLERVLDKRLQATILPYDRRLDGPDSPLPGTLSDFAPRALRHFSQLVASGLAGRGSLEDDHAAVEGALEGWSFPEVPKRVPKSDLELQAIICEHWDVVGGRSGQMLRHLRDNLLIACEQGRFRRLFNEIAEGRSGAQEELR